MAKRIGKRYRVEAVAGLKHCGAADRRSNHAQREKFRKQVLRLVGDRYSGGIGERFGPTLAAGTWPVRTDLRSMLRNLRRWMPSAGLWSRERKRGPCRKRRERKGHFGELSNRGDTSILVRKGTFLLWYDTSRTID